MHVPEPIASTHPPCDSPVPPTATVTNAFKEENRGCGGPCATIKMATKEEKVLGVVLIKDDDDDDKRCLNFSTNDNDASDEG